MTTTTMNTTALLVAAVETLNAQISAAKKAGMEVPGIGTEIAPGIKLRDLKSWHKEFKAKQADASKPAEKAAAAPKAPAAAKATATAKAVGKAIDKVVAKAAPAPAAEELKSGAIREAGVVLIGRAKEAVLRISKINDVRTVVTDKGTKIAVSDLEFNNRGTLRVKLDAVEKYTAAPAAPVKTAAAAPKATAAKKGADAQEDFAEEPVAAATERKFPVRVLTVKKNTVVEAAEYDRNTQTLFVTLKDGAVWAYEGVKLSEVRAFEQSPAQGKHFSAHIANDKKGRMVKNHKAAPVAEKAPVKTVAVKPAAKTTPAKAASAPVPQVAEISTTALRAAGFLDGRKHEAVQSIMRVKETGERVVVTASGKRIPLSSIVLAKGKFRVADLHDLPAKGATAKAAVKAAAVKPAATENTRKAAANGKAGKLDFGKAETAKATAAKAPVVSEKPSRDLIKTAGVRVIKGTKEKIVDVLRIVNREGVSTVVSTSGAHHGLPLSLIISFDGQPTYTGKITADEFRAL